MGTFPANRIMAKPKTFLKAGKVVIILQGRFAGKKAVVVKTFDEGTREREFGHCLVAGIEKAPLRVTKSMSKKKIIKRSRSKPFVKFVNYNHLMPTRYAVDIPVRDAVNPSAMKKADTRKGAKKMLKKLFNEKYMAKPTKVQAGVEFFFTKLRF